MTNHGSASAEDRLGNVLDDSYPHSYSLYIRVGEFQIREWFGATSYRLITLRFEAAIRRLKEVQKDRNIRRCPDCGQFRPLYTSFCLWVDTGDETILKENHYEIGFKRMIQLLEWVNQQLRARPELPQRCKRCQQILP
jgi:hypothetical protein